MNRSREAWAWTLAFIACHQIEEVTDPIQEWSERVGGTGIGPLDRHLARGGLADRRLWVRCVAQAGQCAGLGALWLATRRSPAATRAVTTALVTAWSAAMVGHLAIAARMRSAAPGTATSVFPGLPGAAFVLHRIWRT